MTGRNGHDELNRFLLVLDLLFLLLSAIFREGSGRIFWPLAVVFLIITYFRMFSRDLVRRGEENARYLQLLSRINGSFRLSREKWSQRKDYKFFVCPECKTTLRVPKGRGKIKIVCRKCGHSFTGKS
ncbi:MAG: hypothetical protein IJQ02_15445 [Oscillospiraceae bacterium]|nr:hypothetical protein [Oscillospiraceae bacterium]